MYSCPEYPEQPRKAPELTDGVIRLNGHRLLDTEAYLAGEDAEHQKWLSEGQVSTRASVTKLIQAWQLGWKLNFPAKTWAVRDAKSYDLLGGGELRLYPDKEVELSYWTFPEYRGNGYALNTTCLLTDYAFSSLHITRALLYIDTANKASLRVAEKASFTKDYEFEHLRKGDKAAKQIAVYYKSKE